MSAQIIIYVLVTIAFHVRHSHYRYLLIGLMMFAFPMISLLPIILRLAITLKFLLWQAIKQHQIEWRRQVTFQTLNQILEILFIDLQRSQSVFLCWSLRTDAYQSTQFIRHFKATLVLRVRKYKINFVLVLFQVINIRLEGPMIKMENQRPGKICRVIQVAVVNSKAFNLIAICHQRSTQ